MRIEEQSVTPVTEFGVVPEGGVFKYKGEYFMRTPAAWIEALTVGKCFDAVRLRDGRHWAFEPRDTVEYIPNAKLVV